MRQVFGAALLVTSLVLAACGSGNSGGDALSPADLQAIDGALNGRFPGGQWQVVSDPSNEDVAQVARLGGPLAFLCSTTHYFDSQVDKRQVTGRTDLSGPNNRSLTCWAFARTPVPESS